MASDDRTGEEAGRPPWTAETLPRELLDILDARAGRTHSRTGSVVSTLAEILNRYDQLHEAP